MPQSAVGASPGPSPSQDVEAAAGVVEPRCGTSHATGLLAGLAVVLAIVVVIGWRFVSRRRAKRRRQVA
ncbi:MAG: hypothetical protein H6745_12910 [Deltaproteobacteria bacterium]|nr:hypothetical protein [Deltaproteobacteria bacterium]